MGYCITLVEHDFLIPSENIDKALEKINNKLIDGNDYKDIKQAFKKYGRWEMKETEKGLTIDYFSGEKYGWGEEKILDTVAEYVEDESFVTMAGTHDGERWRYYFKNGEMKEQTPQKTEWG